MAIADTILKLSAASGPSGFERDVGALAAGLLDEHLVVAALEGCGPTCWETSSASGAAGRKTPES
jgi:hypothetical protein